MGTTHDQTREAVTTGGGSPRPDAECRGTMQA